MKKINGGYILQPRLYDHSEISKKPPVTRELWLYLLRNVNHKDNGKLKRGQGFFNINNIRERLCWYIGYRKNTYSKTQIAKSLRRLCEDSAIDTTKTTRGLIITILNYDYYQDPKNYEDYNERTTKDLRRPSTDDTIYKNDKNKEEEKYNNICPQKKIVELYHSMLPELPKILEWNPTRKTTLRARWNDNKDRQDINWWVDFFNFIRESDFLMGRTPEEFKPNLAWIIKQANMIKIIEGNYHRNKKRHIVASTQQQKANLDKSLLLKTIREKENASNPTGSTKAISKIEHTLS